MVVKAAELLSTWYAATAFEVGRATKARWDDGKGWEDDPEGEDEPHPTRVANPSASQTIEVRLLAVIEPPRGKRKFRHGEVSTDLRNMASEISRLGCDIVNSKFRTPANMAVMENQTG